MSRGPTESTFYARLPSWASRVLLACMMILTVLPALPHPTLEIPGERQWGQPAPDSYDVKLYKRIVSDIADGQGYYQAASNEHRLLHFPTAPPQVFRMPTLAWVLAGLHFYVLGFACLLALYAAIMVRFYREFLAGRVSFANRVLCVVAVTTGLSIVGVSESAYWHEVWAALLICLSLLSYRSHRWWPSVMLGMSACLIREIALPYLFVMAGFAITEKYWRQSAAWLGAIVVAVAAFIFHVHLAASLYKPGDLISPGWLAFGGWDFAIATAKWNIAMHALPYPLIALAVCQGIVGLAGSPDGRARRAAVIVAGYLTGFLVVGRPNNFYWGILYAPLLPVGFLLAPAALGDLLRSARIGPKSNAPNAKSKSLP